MFEKLTAFFLKYRVIILVVFAVIFAALCQSDVQCGGQQDQDCKSKSFHISVSVDYLMTTRPSVPYVMSLPAAVSDLM